MDHGGLLYRPAWPLLGNVCLYNNVYQDDWICNSHFTSETEQAYYFNLTNTDGDTVVEATDKALSWRTGFFRNGDYKVFVRAEDRSGNEALDSMIVTVANFFTLSGHVTYDDGLDDLTGTIVTAVSTGRSDTTDGNGDFSLSNIPGARQSFTIERLGCQSVDTGMIMYSDRELVLNSIASGHIPGDANYDGSCNIGDVVYLVNYIFHDGLPPPA